MWPCHASPPLDFGADVQLVSSFIFTFAHIGISNFLGCLNPYAPRDVSVCRKNIHAKNWFLICERLGTTDVGYWYMLT